MDGQFILSDTTPVFTAQGHELWIKEHRGTNLYWPVDRYFATGQRTTEFLDHRLQKYHRTYTTYLLTLLHTHLRLDRDITPTPTAAMVRDIPGMAQQLRRPNMLIVATTKTATHFTIKMQAETYLLSRQK